jgi:predicted ATP-dependent protease
VIGMGTYSFGRPSRITATVNMGKGDVLNIEREIEMSGPFHSKGVLILASYIRSRYAQEQPLSLDASLVFEQSYGGVDGDSASSTELYALLSAIAQAPLKQSIAVTGSVNQLGQVQAIGGVNEKIEGFFDLCKARGLTGEQGVMIPSANVKHLMLRHDVIDAVADGLFHIYPISTIDEGIEVLTGEAAGVANDKGIYPKGTINRMVSDRLAKLAEKRRELDAEIFHENEDKSKARRKRSTAARSQRGRNE